MVEVPKTDAINDTISHRNGNPERSSDTLNEVANLLQLETFAVASWNLQGGLQDGRQFQCVARDMGKRLVDIGCLQETHNYSGAHIACAEGKVVCLEDSSTGNRLTRRYGLGFFIGQSLEDHVVDHRLVSNRIAVLRLRSALRAGSGPRRKSSTICIINVYAPTAQRAVKYPVEYQRFYDQLEQTVRECHRKSVTVIVAGDFNSKLGLQKCSESGELEAFMGAFGKGTRNRNGGYLATFLDTHRLYAANTHRQHPMRHRSTWHGLIRVQADGSLLRVRNQIDYVCVQQRLKKAIIDGRSYSNNLFSSDHAMVVVRLRLNAVYGKRKGTAKVTGDRSGSPAASAPSPCRNLCVHDLSTSLEARREYQEKLSQFCAVEQDPQSCLTNCVQQAARAVLPEKAVRTDCRIEYLDDARIRDWSQERATLLLKLQTINAQEFVEVERVIKEKRSRLTYRIKKRVRKLRQQAIEEVATELENTPNCQRQFAACRVLKKKQPYKCYQLVDENGFRSTSPARNIPLTEVHYEQFFNPEGAQRQEPVDPWGPHSGELTEPLTPAEVQVAMSTLRNGRAVGPDGIPGELLKYGGEAPAEAAAKAVNNMFVQRKLLSQLGEGLLIPLNKPGKPAVPEHTRPITLLNTFRKTISMAILNRTNAKIDEFLPRSQCGFRRRRSTMDVAWMYGWLRAVGNRYQRTIEVYGIDMSKAFDTIQRGKLLWILETAVGLSQTEVRLIRTLLAGTTLRVKVSGRLGKKFPTTLGIPQGDALSPILFVVYLEAAMREVRVLDNARNWGHYIGRDWFHEIMEAAYADDVDLICVDKTRLDKRLEMIVEVFSRSNLRVNEAKTERITIDCNAKIPTHYKKLGSHVDADEDMRLRIQKANLAFHSMWTVWKCSKISIAKRLRMYGACVKPILLYNIGACAYAACQLSKLDAAHRRHLRYLLGIFYPNVITIAALYSRAHARPLREDIVIARWRSFKTALHQDEYDERMPTASVMRLYFHNHFGERVTRRGAPPTSLPVLLNRDLKLVGRKLLTPADYKGLKELVKHAKEWAVMADTIAKRTTEGVLVQAVKRRMKRKGRGMTRIQMDERAHEARPKRQRRGEAGTPAEHRKYEPPPRDTDESSSDCDSTVRVRTRRNTVETSRLAPVTRNAKRRRPEMTTIPEERPTTRRKITQAVAEDATSASVERNQRLDDGLNVNNGVISGRTF